jgi:hypothetical protein
MNPTTHHRFGALRSLLNREPSTEVWYEVLEQLEGWSGDALEALALPYVREHLRRWPDTIQRSPGWDDRERWRSGDDSGPTLWLANHMQIGSADQLARLASHPLAAQITSLELTRRSGLVFEDHAEQIAAALNAMPALRALEINRDFLTRRAPEAPALIAALANPALRSLKLRMIYSASIAEALLDGQQLDTLERLHLWHSRAERCCDGAGALLSSPRCARLTTLDLSSIRVPSRDAARMGELPARLTTLILRRAGLTDAGVAALLRAPALDTLTTLDLSGNALGVAGARAIAESPRLRGLTRLSLRSTTIGAAGARVIAASPSLSRLETLDLYGAGAIGALPELLGSPHLRGLRDLDVNGRLSADVARRIADGEDPPHLSLPLRYWRIGADAGAALARSPALGHTTDLSLGGEHMAPAAQAALLRSPFITALRDLEITRGDDPRANASVSASLAVGRLEALESCHIIASQDDESDIWARAVAANAALRQLKSLTVWGVVTDGAQQALAQATHLQRLESLRLYNNAPPGVTTLPALIASSPALRELYAGGALSLEAAQGLASCAEAARLEELYLCVERGEAASALLSSPHLQQLKRIHISPLGDAGCEALARTPLISRFVAGFGPQRFDIDLSDCEVTPAGLAALLSSPHLPPTFSVDLGRNPLGDEGAALLAAHPTLARITALALDGLTKEGVHALAASPYIHNLRGLYMEMESRVYTDIDEAHAIMLANPHISRALRAQLSKQEP